jgi:hypothetical protein
MSVEVQSDNSEHTAKESLSTTAVKPHESIRHPLRHAWTLWYDANLAGGQRMAATEWGKGIKEVYTFNTVILLLVFFY